MKNPAPMSSAYEFPRLEARSAELQRDMDLIDATLEHNRALFKQQMAREFDRALEAMSRGMEDVQKEVVKAIRDEAQTRIEEVRKENEELAKQLAKTKKILVSPVLPQQLLDSQLSTRNAEQ